MKGVIKYEEANPILEMARIGWIPSNTTKTIEVYVHTDDPGKIPHFHVRKYNRSGKFDWEVCIKFQCAEYFNHGSYDDKLPDRKIANQLDKMLREVDRKSRFQSTYWEEAVEDWNRNNSDAELDLDLVQPDYTKLK